MKESVTYQAILEEGRAEGRAKAFAEGKAKEARCMLLRLGQKRFGPPGDAVIAAIERITDHQQAEALIERVFDMTSWDEVFAPLASAPATWPAEGRSLILEGIELAKTTK